MKFRNVRVKMKGGKTRIQRAMVLASGKLKFVKNVTRSRSSRKARHNPNSGGKTRRMARRKRGGHRSRKIPLAPVAGLAYGVTNGVWGGSIANSMGRGDYADALRQLSAGLGFNPYSGKIELQNAKLLHGLIGGGIIHIAASRLGVNRAIQKLPLVNI